VRSLLPWRCAGPGRGPTGPPARSLTLGSGREKTPTLVFELGVFSTGWLGLEGPAGRRSKLSNISALTSWNSGGFF
jgi:hypothetical protein